MGLQTTNFTPYRVPGIKLDSEDTMFSGFLHGSVPMTPNLSSQSTSSDKTSGGFSMSSDTTYNSFASPPTPGYYEQGLPNEFQFENSCDGLPQYFEDPPSSMYPSNHDHSPSHEAKPTPSSLGWTNYKYLDLYTFVVEKGKEPHFILNPNLNVTVDNPIRVYLDQPKKPQKNSFPCLYPGCSSKQTIFARTADLDRHYESVHLPPEQKPKFPCTHEKCSRYKKPFGRKDHFRDHLRDFHKEDIGTAKNQKGKKDDPAWSQTQAMWLDERRIYATYWTCGKCLVKMTVKNHGWKCTNCNIRCEEDRIQARLALSQKDSGASTSMAYDDVKYEEPEQQIYSAGGCEQCNVTQGWVENNVGGWDVCPNCALYGVPNEQWDE